jgi:hypothetical protein
MGILSRKKGTKNRDAPTEEIHVGRVSGTSNMSSILSPYRSRSANLLEELRMFRDEGDAVEFCSKKIPDVAKALWNMMRLLNLGNKMEFIEINTGEPVKEIESEWREFASRINSISSSGLDGLIDQFHRSAILRGGQGCEVVVLEDMSDVEDVYPIKPQSIRWQSEVRENKKVWMPYQYSITQKVALR